MAKNGFDKISDGANIYAGVVRRFLKSNAEVFLKVL